MKRAVLAILLSLAFVAWAKPSEWVEPERIASILTVAEQDAGIPVGLAHCVAYAESRFKQTARSKVVDGYRSCGLMQLNRRYLYGSNGLIARFSSVPADAFLWDDPVQNAEIGCRYLAYLIDRFGGSVWMGLAAYNWGPTKLSNIKEWSDVPRDVRKYADGILAMLDEWSPDWAEGEKQ